MAETRLATSEGGVCRCTAATVWGGLSLRSGEPHTKGVEMAFHRLAMSEKRFLWVAVH